MRKQSVLLGVARSTITYKPMDEDTEDIRIKRLLGGIYMKDPCLGSRRLVTVLERNYDMKVDRKRVARLRREMDQETICCRPRTSIPDDNLCRWTVRGIEEHVGERKGICGDELLGLSFVASTFPLQADRVKFAVTSVRDIKCVLVFLRKFCAIAEAHTGRRVGTDVHDWRQSVFPSHRPLF